MDNPVLVSLCITTRNRRDQLEETLRKVLLQLPIDFEIVVVDGDSSDGTEAFLRELSALEPRVRFKIQNLNLGLDAGYAQAANESAGKYIMFSGDDDHLADGSLARVRARVLSEPCMELLVLNYSVFDPSMTKLLVSSRLNSDSPGDFSPHQVDQFFGLAGGLMTFIGSVLVSRERWNHLKQEDFLDSYFIHVGAALSSPMSGRLLLEHEPVFLARGGVPSWNTRAAEIWLFKWPEVIQKLDALSLQFRKEQKEAWRRRLPNAILWQRALGNIAWGNFEKLWVHFPPATKLSRLVLILSNLVSFRILNAVAIFRVRQRIKSGSVDQTWELYELLSGRLSYLNHRKRKRNPQKASSSVAF